jgi:hypothetical protein
MSYGPKPLEEIETEKLLQELTRRSKCEPFICSYCGVNKRDHTCKYKGSENLLAFTVDHPLNILSNRCRKANDTWWRDPITGDKITRNKGELIALMHSELSECLEGLRKGLQDDHLPQYPMELVELVDTLIRIFDYIGEYYPASENDNSINLGNAFEHKMKYNAKRLDHKPEERIKNQGKRF